jgi:hypothetical protein
MDLTPFRSLEASSNIFRDDLSRAFSQAAMIWVDDENIRAGSFNDLRELADAALPFLRCGALGGSLP